MKSLARRFRDFTGLAVVPADRLKLLQAMEAMLKRMLENGSDAEDLLDLITNAIDSEGLSQSQLRQDIFVILTKSLMKNGYFIDVGAASGVEASNTYFLEKAYAWRGILVEPARTWHASLELNRTAKIDHSCVWGRSGEQLNFTEADIAELSTVTKYKNRDAHSANRKSGKSYKVSSISLNDLIEKHGAPRQIDYLSIDTEGSEFEILSNFDFSAAEVSIITCEHNYTEDREKIFRLLTANGYTRRFEIFSKWDDWYFRPGL